MRQQPARQVYNRLARRPEVLPVSSQPLTIRQAVELTEREGYTLQEWLWVLNRKPSSPSRLVQVSEILEAIRSSSMKHSKTSSSAGEHSG